MRAAIYTRLSMDRDGTSTATDRQESDCRALCESRGWSVAGVYTESGVSAYKLRTRRPAFEQMLKDASSFDVVVVYRVDRLARRGRDLERFLAIDKMLASVSEPEFLGPSGLLMLRIISAFSENESTVKGERTARANKERAALGKPHGGRRRFGYTELWQPHPTEAPLVQGAVARLLRGDSPRAVTRDWNARGITTVAGATWTARNFARMMRAPYLAGRRQYHGEQTPGTWPALIDAQTWETLQVVLTPREGHKTVTRHLLSGLARCACGGPMYGVKTTKGYVEYRCDQEAGCGRVSIRSLILEPEVERQLFAEAPKIIRRQQRQAQANRHLATKLRELDRDTEALEELNTARYVERSIDQATYARAKRQLDERIAVRRSEIAQMSTTFRLAGDLELIDLVWQHATLEYKRTLLEALVERIEVRPGRTDRVTVEFR